MARSAAVRGHIWRGVWGVNAFLQFYVAKFRTTPETRRKLRFMPFQSMVLCDGFMTQTAARTPNQCHESGKNRAAGTMIRRSGTRILGQPVTLSAAFSRM